MYTISYGRVVFDYVKLKYFFFQGKKENLDDNYRNICKYCNKCFNFIRILKLLQINKKKLILLKLLIQKIEDKIRYKKENIV